MKNSSYYFVEIKNVVVDKKQIGLVADFGVNTL